MTAAYDPDNIFAKILRGELPCHKVYEDERVLAFLDIMPRSLGHTGDPQSSRAKNFRHLAPTTTPTSRASPKKSPARR
jgi:histidine triad (HIT) family protein